MFGKRRQKVRHTDTMHYVSIIEMLQCLLSYHNFLDGSIFQNHPDFKANPTNCLQIKAYYDELELCNPLGTNVKKYKIG
uniref:Uncharacterized protein n=1 Tax=Amphimedon queenslandica TaxID=400682 RepID=A0A1X7UC52_AMPQE